MEKVILTKYKSKVNDILFDTEEECLNYEKEYDKVMVIYNILPDLTKGKFLRFAKSKTKHNMKDFNKFKRELFKYIKKEFKIKDTRRFNGVTNEKLKDFLIYKAWHKYQCIDDGGWEYSLPLYYIREEYQKQIEKYAEKATWNDKFGRYIEPTMDKYIKELAEIKGE